MLKKHVCPRCGKQAILIVWPFAYRITEHGSRVGWPEACRACVLEVQAAVDAIPPC